MSKPHTISYKGKEIKIHEHGDHGEITIDDKVVQCKLHPGTIPHWSCDLAYLCAGDLQTMAKHLVDNWEIITSPNTAPPVPEAPEDEGGGQPGHGHGTEPQKKPR